MRDAHALSLRGVCVDFPLSFRYKSGVERKEATCRRKLSFSFPRSVWMCSTSNCGGTTNWCLSGPNPLRCLAYLATHPGRLVTAAELRKAVWPDTYVGEGLLRGYIREVRIVLGDDPEVPRFIETVPRRGYRFLAVSSQ